ncbi:hypothetical protein [Synechococcus sp. CC9616]|uniref:hypothetical protein n=1 Tax=Synechococcus sp. CC9616 TaxID=110663 RepID=UPI0004907117|nr:hypothetical protein [Synechococcus sp. CC9616]
MAQIPGGKRATAAGDEALINRTTDQNDSPITGSSLLEPPDDHGHRCQRAGQGDQKGNGHGRIRESLIGPGWH